MWTERASPRQSGPPCRGSEPLPVSAVAADVQVIADVDVPQAVSGDAVADLVEFILAEEGAGGAWSIGIRFTSDAALQRMHREFMGIDTPTDIMTFPYGGDEVQFPGSVPEEVGGDLVISVDRARENARSAGWSMDEELVFLVAHGLLHLLGWDDLSESDRTAMLGRQHQLLQKWMSSRPRS